MSPSYKRAVLAEYDAAPTGMKGSILNRENLYSSYMARWRRELLPSKDGRRASDDYLTSGEAAQRLHVSAKTVNRWAYAGRIPSAVTLGGQLRFRRENVEAAARRMSEGRSRSF